MDWYIISSIIICVVSFIVFLFLMFNTNYRKPLNYYEELRNKKLEKEFEVEEEIDVETQSDENSTNIGNFIIPIGLCCIILFIAFNGTFSNFNFNESLNTSSNFNDVQDLSIEIGEIFPNTLSVIMPITILMAIIGAVVTLIIGICNLFTLSQPTKQKRKRRNKMEQERNTYEKIRDAKIKRKLGVEDKPIISNYDEENQEGDD